VPPIVVREVTAAEGLTARGDRLLLRLAIDYSGRDAILAAAMAGPSNRREFRWSLERAVHARTPVPDVDLLVRTGGERRLSDFMLWESAYAELVFSDVAWPAFTVLDLASAVTEFRSRDRRYGGVRHAGNDPTPLTPPWPAGIPGADSGPGSLRPAAIAHAPRR
jgi:undecaprenyl diphosphate synthase